MIRSDPPKVRGTEGYDARIEVLIDADGEPVMNTLKITGQVGGNARFALESWIRESHFIPANRNGTPVAGTFIMGIERTVTIGR